MVIDALALLDLQDIPAIVTSMNVNISHVIMVHVITLMNHMAATVQILIFMETDVKLTKLNVHIIHAFMAHAIIQKDRTSAIVLLVSMVINVTWTLMSAGIIHVKILAHVIIL